MSKFLHDDDAADNDDDRAMTMHRRFFENSRAKNILSYLTSIVVKSKTKQNSMWSKALTMPLSIWNCVV